MRQHPLKVALAGAGDLGGKCLDALAQEACWTLVGLSDQNARAGEKAAATAAVPFFRDHRLLLTQLRPDVLIVATPAGPAVELVRLAVQMKVQVIKAAPLARTLEEAVGLVKNAEAAGQSISVLAPRRASASYRGLIQGAAGLGRVFLARAVQMFNWGGPFGWRGDQASAGGGVLLEAGYEMIDLVVWAMGLPEEVYAVTGRQGRPHMVQAGGDVESLGVYDTDDTAVATLRYGGGAAANIIVSWAAAPATEFVSLHGQAGSAEARPTECIFRDSSGKVLQRIAADDRPVSLLAEQLKEMEQALSSAAAAGHQTPATEGAAALPRVPCSAREHLLTMAVLEAAYLSDRTGQPEHPPRLLERHGLSAADCTA
jgi:predicted dehydrogenase